MTAIVETRALSSVKSLIIANVITIVIAVFEDWNLRELMLIYWTQSVTIGYFSFRRMLDLKQFSTEGVRMNGRPVEPTEKTKKNMAGFFALHYGMFHGAYLVFIFNDPNQGFQGSYFLVVVCAAVFAFNHWYSYVENREQDADRTPNIGTVMFFPYARIIPMHITIVAGGTLGGASTSMLLLFLGLKTVADVIMHKVKHHDWKNFRGSRPGRVEPGK